MPTTLSLPALEAHSVGWTRLLRGVNHADAKSKTVEALKTVGFGILTEIDVGATFQTKMDTALDRPYVILGAFSPSFAQRALQLAPAVGLLMPFNVVITMNPPKVEDSGEVAVVSVVHPERLLARFMEVPGIKELAKEVADALQKAIDSLP